MEEEINIVPNRNLMIDIGRFFASFLVVCLHTKFPIPFLAPFVADLAKIAVPFFFLVSGYYLFDHVNKNAVSKITKSIRKTIKILFFAILIYAILRVIKSHFLNIDISIQNFKLIPFLLFNDSNFTEHLWYLFAFLYVLIFLLFLYKLNFARSIIYLLLFFIPFHFALSIYSRTFIENSNLIELNWFVTGIPFTFIGILFKEHYVYLTKVKKQFLIYLILFSFIGLYVEHFLFKMVFTRGPGVFFTFLLAVSCLLFLSRDYRILNNKWTVLLSSLGQKHSLNIYIYHILFREIFSISGFDLTINNSLVVFLISLLFSVILVHFKEKYIKISKQ